MDSLIQVKQLGSTLFSLLLIPSIFVAIVFFGKLIDSYLSKPAVYNYEAILGFLFAVLIGLKSWDDQNKSTFLIKNVLRGAGIGQIVNVSNLSDAKIKLTIDVYDGDTKIVFTETLKKYEQTNLALLLIAQLENNDAGILNIKISADTSKNNIAITAANNIRGEKAKLDIET